MGHYFLDIQLYATGHAPHPPWRLLWGSCWGGFFLTLNLLWRKFLLGKRRLCSGWADYLPPSLLPSPLLEQAFGKYDINTFSLTILVRIKGPNIIVKRLIIWVKKMDALKVCERGLALWGRKVAAALTETFTKEGLGRCYSNYLCKQVPNPTLWLTNNRPPLLFCMFLA